MKATYEGQLEIDFSRGVIYFHLTQPRDIMKYNMQTILRICGLPPSAGPLHSLIDISFKVQPTDPKLPSDAVI